MLYKSIIRPLLFKLDPETAHKFTLRCLRFNASFPFGRAITRLNFKRSYPSLKREVFGIEFPNPVGLAGGLDKDGEYYNLLSDLGFGFVEIGSLTTAPQDGNHKPRLWRLPKDRALVNHMGINNKGIINAIEHIKAEKPDVIIVGNISKLASALGDDIPRDYIKAFSLIYDFVDMIVVNVSCPNVEGLTNLQDITFLSDIMDDILDRRMGMEKRKPVLVKISPDLDLRQVDEIVQYCRSNGVDGIVAGNTTRSRSGLSTSEVELSTMEGGLSGAPLFERTLKMVSHIYEQTSGRLPVVGCGGITTPAQAKMVLDAGASLVEVYTGFIYEGPAFVRRILKFLNNSIEAEKAQASAEEPAPIQDIEAPKENTASPEEPQEAASPIEAQE